MTQTGGGVVVGGGIGCGECNALQLQCIAAAMQPDASRCIQGNTRDCDEG